MGFYKNVVIHKDGDIIRLENTIYIWFKKNWCPLPKVYQEVYSVCSDEKLPKNIPISWTLQLLLSAELTEKEKWDFIEQQ